MRFAAILLVLLVALVLLVLNHERGMVMGMETADFARMVVVGTFGLTIGAAAVQGFRGRFGEGLKAATTWALLFALLIVGYAFKDEVGWIGQRAFGVLIPGTVMETGRSGEAAVMRSRDGHFRVRADVDGAQIRFIIDTGASTVVLTEADARAAGLDPSRLTYDTEVATANGRTMAASVIIAEITIGDVTLRRVRGMVAQPGQLDTSLLGNTFLARLASFTVEGDRLTMRQ